MHQKDQKHLAKEIYKFLKGLSPPVMNDIFSFRDTPYNLRNFQWLYSDNKKTVKYRAETIAYGGRTNVESCSRKHEKYAIF